MIQISFYKAIVACINSKRRFLYLHLICFTIFTSYAQTNVLQQPVSIDFSNVSVGTVLDSLAHKTNTYFTYNSALINTGRMVSITSKEEPLQTILNRLLSDSTLAFYVVKKQIVISQHITNTNLSLTESEAQNSFVKISGTIYDAKTNSPLSFANIGISGKYTGTTSNADGRFNLMVSAANFSDTLLVSFLGFKSVRLPVSDAIGTIQNIGLQQDYISLQEIVIRSTDPLILISGAINNFEKNYLQSAANYTSFYRESVHKNKYYMIYIESVLDVYKAPYHTESSDKDLARIYKSRKIHDADKMDTVSFRLQGGIEGCLLMDIIKNRPDFLEEEFFPLYNYTLSDINIYNNTLVYIIDCIPKKHIKEAMLQGRVYIEASNLAIIHAEFGYSPKMAEKLSGQMITKKTAGMRTKPLVLDYSVSYRNLNGKYYLNHSLGHLRFRVKNKKKVFSNIFDVHFEMATTNIDTLNVHRIRHKESVHPNLVLSKEQPEYDAGFWGNQSFIEPEEDIFEAIKRINTNILQTITPPVE